MVKHVYKERHWCKGIHFDLLCEYLKMLIKLLFLTIKRLKTKYSIDVEVSILPCEKIHNLAHCLQVTD